MGKKKVLLVIAFVAIAMVSGGIVSIYEMNKGSVEVKGAVQADKMTFSCGVSGCTQTESHQHGLCGIDGCTQIGEHSHGICGVEGCTEMGRHTHNSCGLEDCTQTGEHSHGGNGGGHHRYGHGGGHH